MTAKLHCQGCGRLLFSADAVCAHCEAGLTAEPPSPPPKYICPHCHERFAAAVSASWPPKVPWWRPTTMRLQCPHCDAPVRDRHALQPPGWVSVVIVGAAFCLQLFTTGWPRLLLGAPLLALVAAPLILSAWRIRQDVDNPHRFVAGTVRFWQRGDERLQRAAERVRPRSGEPPR